MFMRVYAVQGGHMDAQGGLYAVQVGYIDVQGGYMLFRGVICQTNTVGALAQAEN